MQQFALATADLQRNACLHVEQLAPATFPKPTDGFSKGQWLQRHAGRQLLPGIMRLQSNIAGRPVQSSGSEGLPTCEECAQARVQSYAATHTPTCSAEGAAEVSCRTRMEWWLQAPMRCGTDGRSLGLLVAKVSCRTHQT